MYSGIEIKQFEKVKYFGYVLDQSISGESMALNVIDKVNSRLKFLHKQNRFLITSFRGLARNPLIRPFFDYACTGWFSNFSGRLKLRL